MNHSELHKAALLKLAAEENAWGQFKDWWSNGLDDRVKHSLIGALGGGLLAGGLGAATGSGFLGPALGGALAGGAGGYFFKPVWKNVKETLPKPKDNTTSEIR